jgi:predicted Ser/Thr protein kinase
VLGVWSDLHDGITKFKTLPIKYSFTPSFTSDLEPTDENEVLFCYDKTVIENLKRVFSHPELTQNVQVLFNKLPHVLEKGKPDWNIHDENENLFNIPIECKTFWGLKSTTLTSTEQLIRAYYSEVESYRENKKRDTRFLGHDLHVLNAISQIIGYMIARNSKYGILTNYNFTWFFRFNAKDNCFEISEPSVFNHPRESSLDCGRMPTIRAIYYLVNLALGEILAENGDFRSDLAAQYLKIENNKINDANLEAATATKSDQTTTKTRNGTGGPTSSQSGHQGSNEPLQILLLQHEFRMQSITRVLGSGLSGTVFLYKDYGGEDIALKRVDIANNPVGFQQVKNELRIYQALSKLQGKCIPKVRFFFDYYPFLYVGFSYIDGQVYGSVASHTREPVRRSLKAALHSIHLEHVVHGDLRNDNVIVDNTGHVWLIDFGMSYLRYDRSFNELNLYEAVVK